MSTELICPDCGGVIGATEPTAEGAPCTCFQPHSSPTPAATDPSPEPTVAPLKLCLTCGKDLAGHQRIRTEGGYLCRECYKAEKVEAEAGRLSGPAARCESCNRLVAQTGLFDYNGMKICFKCREERQRVARDEKRFRAVSGSAWNETSKKQIYWLLGVLGALLLIILLGSLHLLPRIF